MWDSRVGTIRDANSHHVILGSSFSVRSTDARLAVHAVNMHDELVAALEHMTDLAEDGIQILSGATYKAHVAAIGGAREALARAKGDVSGK